jgi:hypothetical protein
MSVAPNDVVKVTFNTRQDGVGVVSNVFYFRNDSGLTLDNESVLDEFGLWTGYLAAQLDDFQSDTITYEEYKVYNMTQDQPIGTAPSTLTSGSVDTDAMPSGVAALITLDTGFKKTLGKKFIGGLVEAATTAGVLTPATIAYLEDVYDLFLFTQSLGGHDWMPGVWKKATSAFYPFISAVIRSVPAYQRRRKAGVGI